MKKVCHITDAHSASDVRVFQHECKSLVKAGYDVTYITPNTINQIIDGVKIVSININTKPIYRLLTGPNMVYKKALEIDADIYHFHDVELFKVGLKLKRKGKIVIFDSHENWIRYVIGIHWMPKILKWLGTFYLKRLYKKHLNKFDAVIVVSPHMIKDIKPYNERVYVVSNYPSIDKKDFSYLKDYLKRDNILLYPGSVYRESNQEVILNALTKIENINYHIAGKFLDHYEKILSKHPSWNRVSFLGMLPREEIKKEYQKATIGIILLSYYANVGYKQGTMGNTKLFEYMMEGLPVICTDFDSWKDKIIDKYNCGICVNPYDVDDVICAIQYLIENKDAAYQMGQNGRKAVVNEFNWETQSVKLLKLYNSL